MCSQFALRLHLVVDSEGRCRDGGVLEGSDADRVQSLRYTARLTRYFREVLALQVQRQNQIPRFLVDPAGGFAIGAHVHQGAVVRQRTGQRGTAQADDFSFRCMRQAQCRRVESRMVAVGAHQLHGVVGRR